MDEMTASTFSTANGSSAASAGLKSSILVAWDVIVATWPFVGDERTVRSNACFCLADNDA